MKLGSEELRSFRRHAQMIFQDPFSSLNPRMTVFESITEPLKAHGITDRKQLEARSFELMELVGLAPSYLRRYPHAFSGGQRQRIGIARALALNPKLIVADEPVSALDVSVQAQIINLLKDLQKQLNIAFLFISHDLGVVKHTCDRIAVMYAGKIVEEANTEDLYSQPLHPYSEALLSSVPRPDPRFRDDEIILSGEVPDPANLPAGCPFHPRCPYAEALRRLPTRHSAFDSGNNTFTQVERESLRHRDWPPSASLNVESDESRFGNPASIQYERKPL
jgi:peptide/nickel transport system ATP-binding protein